MLLLPQLISLLEELPSISITSNEESLSSSPIESGKALDAIKLELQVELEPSSECSTTSDPSSGADLSCSESNDAVKLRLLDELSPRERRKALALTTFEVGQLQSKLVTDNQSKRDYQFHSQIVSRRDKWSSSSQTQTQADLVYPSQDWTAVSGTDDAKDGCLVDLACIEQGYYVEFGSCSQMFDPSTSSYCVIDAVDTDVEYYLRMLYPKPHYNFIGVSGDLEAPIAISVERPPRTDCAFKALLFRSVILATLMSAMHVLRLSKQGRP